MTDIIDERKQVLTNYMLLPADEHEVAAIYNAMDEWFERRGKELLDYVAVHVTDVDVKDGQGIFLVNGEWITREMIFQNFL